MRAGERPRLVASDLDGTLLRSDGTVSARTRRVIAAVVDAGVPFVAVTARAARSLGPLTGVPGFAVCANGAVTVDIPSGRALRRHLLSPDVAAEATAALRAALPDLRFAVELTDGTLGHELGYVASRRWPGSPRSLAELLADGALKLVGHHPHLGSDALLTAARAAVGDTATVTASSAQPFVEVGPPGVDKASGLAAVAAELGVAARDVVAFGDMPNDVPMLFWAGHGVAVANAHPDVLAVADAVALHHDSDGVARVLERWFPV